MQATMRLADKVDSAVPPKPALLSLSSSKPALQEVKGRILAGHTVVLSALIVLLASVSEGRAQTGVQRPNVLFIAIDDLNDWVGCMGGHPQTRTPNMDALASRGVLFTNAHCQGPICGPSRSSLLSGKYPHTTGVYQQPAGKPLELDQVHFRGHLLPEYFSRHGYRTYACGKISHGYSAELAFDEYGGSFDGFGPKPKERFHYFLPENPYTGTQTDWGAYPDVDSKMPDFKTATWCIDQLRRQQDRPFFLAAGFYRPHVPFYVPQKWFDHFPVESIQLPEIRLNDLDDIPEIGRKIHEMPKYPGLQFLLADDNNQYRKAVQAYLACVEFVDYQVGRLIDALEASPYAQNTVVVLFSDHGYHLGEKDRVSKHSLWEEATHVPLIVVDGTHRGATCDAPVGLIDIYPTLIDLCGLPARGENQGQSLVPLLNGSQADWRDAVLTTYARGNHSLRARDFRYIRYEDGSEELYDHRTDPHEWTNLAGQPGVAERIKMFRAQLPRHEAAYHAATEPGPVNAWFAQHLKANGVE